MARGAFDAVVHAAAIPAVGRHAPHIIFGNNLMATFNVVEACVRTGVSRLVFISSETVPGFIFAERPFLPACLPVDEAHRAQLRTRTPWRSSSASSSATRRCAARIYAASRCGRAGCRTPGRTRNLGPFLRELGRASVAGRSYVDAYDLAAAIRLAFESDLPGRNLHEAWRAAYPDATTELRPVSRRDASGISTRKAEELLGWRATRSWRDYLTEEGEPIPGRDR